MDTKMPARIPASSFDYLKMLKENNDRDWFNENKDRYLKEYDSLEHFADALLQELRSHDVIETASGKKACTVFIGIRDFLKTRRRIRPIGAVAIKELPHSVGEAIIFISSRATVLLPEVFGLPIQKT